MPCESQRRVNARVVPGPLGLKWLQPRIPRLRSSEAWVPVPFGLLIDINARTIELRPVYGEME